jgi:hypothetical protein
MTPAYVTGQKPVHVRIAAIKAAAIVFLRDWPLMPGRKAHRSRGNAAIAARSFSFGCGGLSRSFRMRRKSRSGTSILPALSMTASASRKARG